jgi:hypothetical protein
MRHGLVKVTCGTAVLVVMLLAKAAVRVGLMMAAETVGITTRRGAYKHHGFLEMLRSSMSDRALFHDA